MNDGLARLEELCVSRKKKQKSEIARSRDESLSETSRLHCVQNEKKRRCVLF